TDSCDHTPNDGTCSDGQYCNGVEVCHPLLGCQAGPPVDCDDGIACTTDSCNEAKDLCIHSPNNGACSDGQFCNGPEICTPDVGCQPGAPPDCDDGVGCTEDSCDEANDRCVNTPDDAPCDDGLYCDGVEVCDPVTGCRAGAPSNCNDGVGCTIDSCDEANNTCVHARDSDLCDDGLFCNGVETCNPGVGCQAGTPPNCADAIDCTIDSCDETNDKCVHVADAGLCNDGDACTTDSCATAGCSHANICGACCMLTGNCVDSVTLSDCLGFPGDNDFHGPGSVCAGDADNDGTDDSCGLGRPDQIPTVSEWGLVILTLLLLTGAKVCFGARRQAA
ncbi:MAG: IPTL-CTERM sorting domain-containing protein, partial [Phycisphaerales bacterium]|nr:IPTL-CTERM sorting domain-containing protein [Phycisphaerales bacterium]